MAHVAGFRSTIATRPLETPCITNTTHVATTIIPVFLIAFSHSLPEVFMDRQFTDGEEPGVGLILFSYIRAELKKINERDARVR